ncbi:MAG: biopolymer transporter ExbD [Gammaproteobacteria bacterium]|nr:MAG: biopolymer transporter ExbD [Gammaproteobacteria bacterium]
MDFEGRARIHSHLDIAPLIDIVFLLLVFFMLTSTFLTPEAIDLQLPESDSAEAAEPAPITVALDSEGRLTLNDESLPLDRLRAVIEPLLKGDAGQTVTIKSDARTEVQLLIKVMDEVRAAGGSSIALATTPASQ